MSIGYFNGAFIPVDEKVIPIDERGHNFGDGVYEVIRVYNGTPFLMTEHLERLVRSAQAIRLPMTQSVAELEALIREGLEKSGLPEAEVYLQVTRGVAKRQHLFPDVPVSIAMTIREARQLPAEKRESGVAVTLMDDERWANCFIKSLNLLPNVLAKQAATDAGFYEAVLVRDGIITEGSSCNVFAVKDGVVYTAPANKKILHGITRAALFQLAQDLGIEMRETEMTPDFLLGADEAFLSSTSMEALAVTRVDQQTIGDGKPGAITRKLHTAYRNLCAQATGQ
ncbi:MAG: D-amino-acid transaminase [Tumebacillaceae bacterium]